MTIRTLGIITNDPDSVFQHTVISGIRDIAEQNHYALAIRTIANAAEISPTLLSELLRFDGLLVIANVLSDDLLRQLLQHGKPISLVSHRVPDTAIPVVVSNNQQGIAELVSYLVNRCGRRRLVFIRGLMDQTDAQERELAFRQDLIRHNLHVPPSFFLRGDFVPTTAAESIQKLLASGAAFDGILATDYEMAIAAVEALREAGIAVPGQVSVVGFGDSPRAEAAGLTTVAASITELGACAARQLISQINGLRIRGVTMLSVRLIVRET